MRGYATQSSDSASGPATQDSLSNVRQFLTYSEDGTYKSPSALSDHMSQYGDISVAPDQNFVGGGSSEARKRILDKLNRQILAEYEGARQSHVLSQQNYRSTVDRFLSFASENKQIYSKILKLHEQVSKEFLNNQASVNVQFTVHLRLIVNVSLLYFKNEQSTSMAKLLIKSPYVAFQAFEDAIHEIWNSQSSKLSIPPPRLGICGWLGRHHVTPRGLSSFMINTLTAVEGVVNKCSSVYPKLSQSVYVGEPLYDIMNEEEKSVHLRSHYDLTDFTKTPKDVGAAPMADPENRVVYRQEIGLCGYRNYQTFVVQETPEDSFTGQMPRYVSVIVQDDLCNIVKCGDRVRVWGVYRAGCGRADETNSGMGKAYLVANNVVIKDRLSQKIAQEITDEDRSKFRFLARRKDCLNILTRSLAPSICGQESVKRGILLQLVGGPETEESADHRIRGDIHVLLVGDPGCGKSQLLRYVMALLPNTVSTTGRGSTGVGLTAAVITDQESGERRVEGGAMVIGDRRVVCIDEFDKMPHGDRVAIHEVLEQQTVTVAKAGIHTTLNARCTVLAAANPLYGCWSEDMEISQQLNFERSLLSRFDLIFVVRDVTTEVEDERIADAVLHNLTHKSQPMKNRKGMPGMEGAEVSCVIQPAEDDMNKVATSNIVYGVPNIVYGGLNDCREGALTPTRAGRTKKLKSHGSPSSSYVDDIFRRRTDMTYIDISGVEHDILDTQFLRKYIYYCRNLYYREMEAAEGWKPYPEISEVARRSMVQLYAQLRERAHQWETKNRKLSQAVTPRTLEAIIRLSVAYAKLTLNRWVTTDCVSAVGRLLNHTLFGDYFNVFQSDANSNLEDDFEDPEHSEDSVKRLRTSEHHTRGSDSSSTQIAIAESGKGIDEKVESESLDHIIELLNCLKKLDVGDGVDISDLFIEFSKKIKITRREFTELLQHIHNMEQSPIVYSAEDFRVFSC